MLASFKMPQSGTAELELAGALPMVCWFTHVPSEVEQKCQIIEDESQRLDSFTVDDCGADTNAGSAVLDPKPVVPKPRKRRKRGTAASRSDESDIVCGAASVQRLAELGELVRRLRDPDPSAGAGASKEHAALKMQPSA